MAEPDEKLFLLEFLVDNVKIHKTPSLLGGLNADESWFKGQTCVTFQFLNFPPLDICEKDFTPCKNSDDQADFKSGKSCLFALAPEVLQQSAEEFLINIVIHRKMPEGVLPDKLTLGDAQVPITEQFNELLKMALESGSECNCPASKTLKETYPLKSLGCCKKVGEITIFVRISCFGKLIVTQFQMNTDKKAFLFKGNEDSAVYQCKKMEAGKTKCGCQGLIEPDQVESRQSNMGGYGNGYGYGNSYGNGYGYGNGGGGYGGGRGYQNAPLPPCYPQCVPYGQPTEEGDPAKKDYEEIGAELNGHALVIRVQKKKKNKECSENPGNAPAGCPVMEGQYIPPCDPFYSQNSTPNYPCPQPSRPQYNNSNAPSPLGCVGMDNNSIQFTMPKQGSCCPPNRNIAQPTLTYKMGECDAGCNSASCGACTKVIKIEPDNSCPAGARITPMPDVCNKDVFVLRIGKKNDSPDKKAKLELELRTPKKEEPRQPPAMTERDTQYLASDCATGGGKKKGKGKGKGKKGKGKKGKKK